ncbi:MAG: histidinol-phosphate transaminase [Puniceicoccales bacterium]|jgi:histidinol-phosphate aminotransferase|nr:histidinol-phosphate transaminase [Puniceicoccales bacterium]
MKRPENDYAALANPAVLTQPTYEPGRPIEDVAREFGLDPAGIIKLASNENAIGPSPLAKEAASRALDGLNYYPDGASTVLRARLAAHWGLRPSQFVIGNGSNEAMILLAQALLCPGDEVVFGAQAFVVYKLAALLFGAKPVPVPMPSRTHDLAAMRAAISERTKLVFLACPNNPTGTVNPAAEILAFARALPSHVVLCLDEAYTEFLEEHEAADIRPLIAEGVKIVGARTFSKIYGLAGLRVGYLYAAEELIALVQRARQPFNVNLPAQHAAAAALDDVDFVRNTRAANNAGLRQIEAGLRALGLQYTPGRGNFTVFDIPAHVPGGAMSVFDALQRRGVIVRPLAGYGMAESLRVTIGTTAQNERFLAALKTVLDT